jgi:hypothetical protein
VPDARHRTQRRLDALCEVGRASQSRRLESQSAARVVCDRNWSARRQRRCSSRRCASGLRQGSCSLRRRSSSTSGRSRLSVFGIVRNPVDKSRHRIVHAGPAGDTDNYVVGRRYGGTAAQWPGGPELAELGRQRGGECRHIHDQPVERFLSHPKRIGGWTKSGLVPAARHPKPMRRKPRIEFRLAHWRFIAQA